MDASDCGVLCQHPGCWATRRRQEKGLARSLPPLKIDDDSSDDEIKLPTQSVCNLLEDYGESPMDRYPLSTGGRPSHSVEGPGMIPRFSPHSFHSSLKLGAPHNTTASILCKQTRSTKRPVKRNPRLRLVEVQEVFDRDDLRAQWDETFVTKQYYVWMPNPGKHRKRLPREYKDDTGVSTAQTNPVLMKDLTECMIPSEIEQKREETILFDEFPVLKKKQPRTKSPGKTPRMTQASQDVILDGQIDREGIQRRKHLNLLCLKLSINELLALPRDTLMKVLELTRKSDFTSPGRLHTIVQHIAQDDERARLALGARHSFQHKQLQAADKRVGRRQMDGSGAHPYFDPSSTKPVYQLDTHADEDHGIIDRLSSVNTPVMKKRTRRIEDERGVLDEAERPESEADSVETFPRYALPLPGIREPMGHPKPAVATQRVLHYRGKIPSISLGLPELPSGIKTTKAFSYKRQDLDFSLGPVITPPSSYRSSEGAAFSDHGTTVKVNVSSTMPGIPDSHYRDDDLMAIHRVSPALSTNVPVPPAGTPATFAHGSPTKSASAGPLQQQYSWDTTRITINWSQSALPPSPGIARGDSAQVARLLSTPQREGEGDRLEREVTCGEERALDTINETAREGPLVEAAGNITQEDADQKQKVVDRDVTGMPRAPTLHLETSTLKRIGAGASPRQQSAHSVESCPSPEQWPLISESSFENIPRPSVSEPALSARSDRRRPISRDSRKDLAARRAMDDNKMKTESPAPPPPSPEPKDHHGESRMRKDLRSRDSLTMAPLFEVAELDEGSPVRDSQTHDSKRHTSQSSRAVGGKYSKKIEVTVPAESEDVTQDEDKPIEDKGGEMISQMTIMHVIPKGRKQGEKRGRELEKVQETFLNVDIPAEDVSSVKADHGSSHQEDISSNDTVVNSQTTGSEVLVTPRTGPPILEEKTEDEDGMEEHSGEDKEQKEENPGKEVKYEKGEVSARDKSLTNALNSYRDLLDVSNESPELLCDSARFISHEQVSPVEGENDDEELVDSHRFVLGGLEGLGEDNDDDVREGKPKGNRNSKESLLGNLTQRLEKDSDYDVRDGESVYDDGDGAASGIEKEINALEEEKATNSDAQPPGVFFFQGSTTSESSGDKTHGPEDHATQEEKEEENDPETLDAVTNQPVADDVKEPEQTNTFSDKETEGKTETKQAGENEDEKIAQGQDLYLADEITKITSKEQNHENSELDSAILEEKDKQEDENSNECNPSNEMSNEDEAQIKLETENGNLTITEDQPAVEVTESENIKEETTNTNGHESTLDEAEKDESFMNNSERQ